MHYEGGRLIITIVTKNNKTLGNSQRFSIHVTKYVLLRAFFLINFFFV